MPVWAAVSAIRYCAAALAALAALALRLLLDPVFADRSAYMPYIVVIMVVAIWVGEGPALLTTLLGLAFGYYFAWNATITVPDMVEIAVFMLTAVGIITMSSIIRQSKLKLKRAQVSADRKGSESEQVAEELNLLIDGAQGLAIYMLDPAGQVTIWNRGAERLKGWSEAEAIGRHTSLFYPSDAVDAGKPETDLDRARAEGRFDEEDWRLRKDGSEFLAAVSINSLYDDSGMDL